MNTAFKDQRAAAFLPFALLCAAAIAAFTAVKVNELNRAPLKTLDEMRAGQPEAQAQPKPEGVPALSPMDGKPLPALAFTSLDGAKVSLASFKGKVLFVNLWATWCAPCREEMPGMQKLYERMKGENFEMIAISIDKDGKKAVAPFVKELGLTFPVLLDVEQQAAVPFHITGVPETFLVSPDGIILHHLVGPTNWDRPEIGDALKALTRRGFIAGKNPPK